MVDIIVNNWKLQTKAYIYEQQEGNEHWSLLTSFADSEAAVTHIPIHSQPN